MRSLTSKLSRNEGEPMTNLNAISSTLDWSNFNATLVLEVTRPEGVFTSTAVAISPDTIVTAAHSLDGKVLKVRVSQDAEYTSKGKFIQVESFEIHPDYNPKVSNFQNDIAKIKLKKPLPANTMIYPLIKGPFSVDGNFIRLGYGTREGKNIRTLITPSFRGMKNFQNTLELDDTFSFSGDSGGPVYLMRNGQMYLVAIHSTYSFGPEGKFSYNPMLSTHRNWLLK